MNTIPMFSQIDATNRVPARGERALVLGGGGATGNAWLIGIVAGLYDAGLDVSAPDLTVGTSAGSTAAAQLAGATPPALLTAALTPSPGPTGPNGPAPVSRHLQNFTEVIAASSGIADMRRRMGAAALQAEAAADEAWQVAWRTTVAARLPRPDWPERALVLTAVDARTGDPVLLDRHWPIDLVDAVAASCAGGPFAYRIGEARLIDGGYRAGPENADLAVGYRRVLVLSPLGGRSRFPGQWRTGLASQVEVLRAGGSRVETIFPSADSAHLFATAMDLSLRAPAARSGYEQGTAIAGRLSDFWC